MEEDTLYDRIGEADLNPTYKDGQVYQHTADAVGCDVDKGT